LLNFTKKFYFIHQYFLLNELIWQEGLLIDFLQKKTLDNWLKKFVIYSGYLFNEKLVFDNLIKFYLNLIIYPLTKFSIFELNNVSNLIFAHVIIFIFIFFFIYNFYLFFYL
jgi:hypothetical protein